MRWRVLVAAGSGSIGGLPLHLTLEAPQPQRSGDASNDAIIQYLLQVGPAAASAQDPANNTQPLYLAIERGRPPTLVRLVLEAHPDAVGMLVEMKEENADTCNTNATSALHVLVSVQGRTALLEYGYFYASAIKIEWGGEYV